MGDVSSRRVLARSAIEAEIAVASEVAGESCRWPASLSNGGRDPDQPATMRGSFPVGFIVRTLFGKRKLDRCSGVEFGGVESRNVDV